jgi:hypothetical protein
VQREILEANEEADIRVYAVWVPSLGGTQDAAELSQRVLPDPRVLHYWDEEALTSAWFAEIVEHSSVPAWDVYYLYDPDAKWSAIPEPLVSSGGTIIGQSAALADAIRPLAAGASAA